MKARFTYMTPQAFRMLPFAEHLELAWKAEHIDYRRGFYRYWTALQRCEQPTEEEIFNHALQSFKAGYQTSERIVTDELWAKELGH